MLLDYFILSTPLSNYITNYIWYFEMEYLCGLDFVIIDEKKTPKRQTQIVTFWHLLCKKTNILPLLNIMFYFKGKCISLFYVIFFFVNSKNCFLCDLGPFDICFSKIIKFIFLLYFILGFISKFKWDPLFPGKPKRSEFQSNIPYNNLIHGYLKLCNISVLISMVIPQYRFSDTLY